MRLLFLTGPFLAAGIALGLGVAPAAQARARHSARPQHCPELQGRRLLPL